MTDTDFNVKLFAIDLKFGSEIIDTAYVLTFQYLKTQLKKTIDNQISILEAMQQNQ